MKINDIVRFTKDVGSVKEGTRGKIVEVMHEAFFIEVPNPSEETLYIIAKPEALEVPTVVALKANNVSLYKNKSTPHLLSMKP